MEQNEAWAVGLGSREAIEIQKIPIRGIQALALPGQAGRGGKNDARDRLGVGVGTPPYGLEGAGGLEGEGRVGGGVSWGGEHNGAG